MEGDEYQVVLTMAMANHGSANHGSTNHGYGSTYHGYGSTHHGHGSTHHGHGYGATYHDQVEPEAKAALHQQWLDDETRVIVATSAFGMGAHTPDPP